MNNLKYLVIVVALVTLSGCTYSINNNTATEKYTDLTACGEFPKTTADGDSGARAAVCRDTNVGTCFYETYTPTQIEGCDPEFNDDTNPYGNEECFSAVTKQFSLDGQTITADVDEENKECAPTTYTYVQSKINQ